MSIAAPGALCATGNQLLASLPASEMEQLRPMLERVHVDVGAVLYEAGSPIRHIYFPA